MLSPPTGCWIYANWPFPPYPLLIYLGHLLWSHADKLLPSHQPLSSSLQPGDLVLCRSPSTSPSPLISKWQGHVKVILTTPTAAKVEGLSYWIHNSHSNFFPHLQIHPWISLLTWRYPWRLKPPIKINLQRAHIPVNLWKDLYCFLGGLLISKPLPIFLIPKFLRFLQVFL